MSSLTVGATATANHESIFARNSTPPCRTAPLASVLASPSMASRRDHADGQLRSRGPNHDGRPSPSLVANGSFDYTQGGGAAATTVGFVSGTSSLRPNVAGIAATLRGAVPTATARQVRNALIMTSNPARSRRPPSTTTAPARQRRGPAYALLLSGTVPDTVDPRITPRATCRRHGPCPRR